MNLKTFYMTQFEGLELDYLASCVGAKTHEEAIRKAIGMVVAIYQSKPDESGCVKVKIR